MTFTGTLSERSCFGRLLSCWQVVIHPVSSHAWMYVRRQKWSTCCNATEADDVFLLVDHHIDTFNQCCYDTKTAGRMLIARLKRGIDSFVSWTNMLFFPQRHFRRRGGWTGQFKLPRGLSTSLRWDQTFKHCQHVIRNLINTCTLYIYIYNVYIVHKMQQCDYDVGKLCLVKSLTNWEILICLQNNAWCFWSRLSL